MSDDMRASFWTLQSSYHWENIIEKSKFIAYAFPVLSVDEAIKRFEQVKKQHYDATHHVPIYIVDEMYKFSDDGEPSGTAGAPIYHMMDAENINRVALVVVRYYGGIKLGTGGLVRAYTMTAKQALQQGELVQCECRNQVLVTWDYSIWGKAEHDMRQISDVIVAEVQYSEVVNVCLLIRPEAKEKCLQSIIELSSGSAIIEVLTDEWVVLNQGQYVGTYDEMIEHGV